MLDAFGRCTTLRNMLGNKAAIGTVALWTMLAPCMLAAQGTVSGRVTIEEREDETTQDLATAVIYLEPVGGTPGPAPQADTEIGMHDKTYIPHIRVVPAGSTVAFANQDPFRHNVFSNSSAGPFDLGLTPRGQSSRNVFRRPGVYAIYCNIHARMSSFVVAVSTPYYTQAGADGAFSIAGVPPGHYVLHAWHERGGETTQAVDVPAGGLDGLLAVLDARGYRIVQHKNKFGRDYDTSDEDERY
jgi:plastocyanin